MNVFYLFIMFVAYRMSNTSYWYHSMVNKMVSNIQWPSPPINTWPIVLHCVIHVWFIRCITCVHIHVYYMCDIYICITCVTYTGVLHVYIYMCITCVTYTCVIHMFYTCNTCVEYTPVLHMQFYTCSTGLGLIPVLLGVYIVIGMGKPWYGPFSIFTNKIEISMGHSL